MKILARCWISFLLTMAIAWFGGTLYKVISFILLHGSFPDPTEIPAWTVVGIIIFGILLAIICIIMLVCLGNFTAWCWRQL